MRITDVCFASGFNNLSNFNRQFLAQKGMPPSRFRALLAENETTRAGSAGRDRMSWFPRETTETIINKEEDDDFAFQKTDRRSALALSLLGGARRLRPGRARSRS